jgi:hypothetical protein
MTGHRKVPESLPKAPGRVMTDGTGGTGDWTDGREVSARSEHLIAVVVLSKIFKISRDHDYNDRRSTRRRRRTRSSDIVLTTCWDKSQRWTARGTLTDKTRARPLNRKRF